MSGCSDLAAGAALLVALGTLTDAQRYVYIGRHLHGRTQQELAVSRGVSQGAIWQLEQAAQRKLAAALAPYRDGLLELVA